MENFGELNDRGIFNFNYCLYSRNRGGIFYGGMYMSESKCCINMIQESLERKLSEINMLEDDNKFLKKEYTEIMNCGDYPWFSASNRPKKFNYWFKYGKTTECDDKFLRDTAEFIRCENEKIRGELAFHRLVEFCD